MGSKSSPNLEVRPSEWCWNLQSHGQLKATIFWGASRRICSLEAKNLTCAINQRRSVLSPSKMIKHSVWKSSKNVWKFITFFVLNCLNFHCFFSQNFKIELNFYAKLGKIMFIKMRLFWSIFIHCVGHITSNQLKSYLENVYWEKNGHFNGHFIVLNWLSKLLFYVQNWLLREKLQKVYKVNYGIFCVSFPSQLILCPCFSS